MPARYFINSRLALACFSLSGEVSAEELEDVYRRCLCDPDWRSNYDVLWDTRRVEVLDINPFSTEGVLSTVTELREQMGPGRSAVVPRRESDLATARTYLRSYALPARIDPHRVMEAFRSVDGAAKWLGLPTDVLASCTTHHA